jgi:parvulin-like peptidyl-prolyl isomerase
MRFYFVALMVCGGVFGQVAVPASAPQPSKVPDDTVVATVDGKKYTAGEVRELAAGLPAQFVQGMNANPENGLQQILLTKYLAEQAAKENLDKDSPYKEQLEFQRNFLLANAEINKYRNSIGFPDEVKQKYYKDHEADYQQAKVRVIYVAFSPNPNKADPKALTEEQAKTKIEGLRKRLVAGADFAKLAQESSDDKESAEKGGEWGIVKRTSNQPVEVKNAIFSLKAGGLSDPVKQANGFYIFKVDEFSAQPYSEVSTQIEEKLKQEKFDAWLKGIQSRFIVKVENNDFFPNRAARPAAR